MSVCECVCVCALWVIQTRVMSVCECVCVCALWVIQTRVMSVCVWVCVSVCVCFVSDSNKSNEHVEMDAEMEAVYDGWNFMSFQNQITSK